MPGSILIGFEGFQHLNEYPRCFYVRFQSFPPFLIVSECLFFLPFSLMEQHDVDGGLGGTLLRRSVGRVRIHHGAPGSLFAICGKAPPPGRWDSPARRVGLKLKLEFCLHLTDHNKTEAGTKERKGKKRTRACERWQKPRTLITNIPNSAVHPNQESKRKRVNKKETQKQQNSCMGYRQPS